MKRVSSVILLAAASLAFEAAAQDWKRELASPLVKIAGRKMVIEEHELCSIPPATREQGRTNSVQVRTRSEAPQSGFISRDHFVAITTAVALNVLVQLGSAECKTLRGPIGSADLQIGIQMTEEGFQVEYYDTRTGQKSRSTTRWQELFAQ